MNIEYLYVLLAVLFVLSFGHEEIIDITCKTRQGSSANGVGSTSSVSCLTGETLVSCGIKGTQNIGGARINPNDKNSCQVLSHYSNSIYPAYPEAVCCIFPSDSILSINDVISLPGTSVSATCDPNCVLTGCHVYYESGKYNQIKGSFTGSQNGPPQTSSWINTDNTCHAESRIGETTVTASARCIRFDHGYTLSCETKATYTNLANFGSCPTGFNMFGCNTFTTSNTLDSYYRNSDGKCYVQQDNHSSQYANAICCQLTKEETETEMCCANSFGQNRPRLEKRLDRKCSKASSETKCLKRTDKNGNYPCSWSKCHDVIKDDDGEYWIWIDEDDDDNNYDENILSLYRNPIMNEYNINSNLWLYGFGTILFICIIFGVYIYRNKYYSEYKQLNDNTNNYGSIKPLSYYINSV